MALFQRKQNYSQAQTMFTVSLTSKTYLIVGLGNPEKKYDNTRHNIGFASIDYFAKANEDFKAWHDNKDLKCHTSEAVMGGKKIILIKPTTYMNLSGDAVKLVSDYYKILKSNTLVIHDELDINFGQIRTRVGGGSAGHNGIKSVIDTIGEDFGRVRVGVGPRTLEVIDSSDFVLGKFTSQEQKKLADLYKEVNTIITEYIFSDQLAEETRSFLI